MRSPSSVFFLLTILGLMVLAICFQLATSAYRLRGNDRKILEERLQRWERTPGYLRSRALLFALGIGFILLATITIIKTWHWRQDSKMSEQKKTLQLDLHIPSVSPDQTYTVVAKFRVRGRAYTSNPLQIKFGRPKSSYPVILYYDEKDPSNNSWMKVKTSEGRDLKQALSYAIGFLCVWMLLFKFAEARAIQRRLMGHSPGPFS